MSITKYSFLGSFSIFRIDISKEINKQVENCLHVERNQKSMSKDKFNFVLTFLSMHIIFLSVLFFG